MSLLTPVDPPISATDAGGMQVLIHWVYLRADTTPWGVYVDGYGKIDQGPLSDLTIDYRLTKDGRWTSVGPDSVVTGLAFATSDEG